MKNKKRKIVITKEAKNKLMIAAAGICLLTGFYGVNVTMASSNQGNREGLVEMLSAKFNLSEADIEETLNQYRVENQAERQVEMKARLEERLNQAVADGKISDDQKTLILNKREEMQSKISQNVENWNEDREVRREQMNSYREEMKQWAEDNGIDTSLVGANYGSGNGKGQGMGQHRK